MTIDPATGYQPFHGRKNRNSRWSSKAISQGLRQAHREPLQDGRREGHEPARDQSAGRDEGWQSASASTARWISTTTRSSAIPRSWRCATSAKKTRPRSKRRSTISPSSSSTATSAASSTAPASPWRRWTSSSSMARSPPISSTSAAAPSKEKVTAAFKLIFADPDVKGILVNIFGGIMRCDTIAEGVIAAVKEVGLKVPLVVRLEGTNVELGKKILQRERSQRHPGRRSRRRREENHRRCEGRPNGVHVSLLDATKITKVLRAGADRQSTGDLPITEQGFLSRHQDGRRPIAPAKWRRDPARAASSRREAADVPLFDSVKKARLRRAPTPPSVYVPPPFAADAILEAIDAEMPLIVCITEGIPVMDMVSVKARLENSKSRLIGPELPGRSDAEPMQDRHHAGQHLQERTRSASSRAPARSLMKPCYRRRASASARRRPSASAAIRSKAPSSSTARPVPFRPRDQVDHHDRRNRRLGRGRRRGS